MPRFIIPPENPLAVHDTFTEVSYHIEACSTGIAENKHLCDLLNSLQDRIDALYEEAAGEDL